MTTHPQFEVFWPRSPRQTGIKPLAGRLESLNGRTIAQIWDFLFKGDEVFAHLEAAIKDAVPRGQIRELARIRQHARRR